MTDTSPLDVAKDAVPGFRGAEAALATVQAARRNVVQLRFAPPPDLAAEVVAAVLAGDGVPVDLDQRAEDAEQGGVRLAREDAILRRAESYLVSRRGEALRTGADDGLEALRPLLANVLAEAGALAGVLDGIDSAEDAIDAGKADEWRRLTVAVDRYRAVRDAQRELFRAATPSGDISLDRYRAGTSGTIHVRDLLAVAGELGNLDEVWSDWASTSATADPPPWPHHPHEPRRPVVDGPYLMWLVMSGALVWVPTVREAVDRYCDLRESVKLRELRAEEERMYGRPLTPEERQRHQERAFRDLTRATRRAAVAADTH